MLSSRQGGVLCIRRCTANGGPRPSLKTWWASPHITETLQAPGGGGAAVSCLSVHRHPGHRKDHLRQDSGQGGQLSSTRWTGDPCNQCASCRGIENGSFLDVLELDAASNNGVEQIRALRDEAVYAPANVKKRVYIVDEVAYAFHSGAFNALLKILEEPPEHSDVHSGHHRAAQGARHHPVPVPAVFLQAHHAPGACAAPPDATWRGRRASPWLRTGRSS